MNSLLINMISNKANNTDDKVDLHKGITKRVSNFDF